MLFETFALELLFGFGTLENYRPNCQNLQSTQIACSSGYPKAKPRFSTEDFSDTSVGTDAAVKPLPLMASAAFCPASALRLAMTTVAPAPARPPAMAKPIPRLQPVTVATLIS